MAIVPMVDAVPGTVAVAAEYNKIIDNVLDLDTRTQALEGAGTPAGFPFLYCYQVAGSVTSVPNNTQTALTWSTELSDTHNWHAPSATSYIPQLAGRYECSGQACFGAAIAGPFVAQFRLNNIIVVNSRYSTSHAVNQAFAYNTVRTEAVFVCNGTTDAISFWVNHNFGSTQSTVADGNCSSYMKIRYLGA